MLFLDLTSRSITRACYIRVHRAGSQLKIKILLLECDCNSIKISDHVENDGKVGKSYGKPPIGQIIKDLFGVYARFTLNTWIPIGAGRRHMFRERRSIRRHDNGTWTLLGINEHTSDTIVAVGPTEVQCPENLDDDGGARFTLRQRVGIPGTYESEVKEMDINLNIECYEGE